MERTALEKLFDAELLKEMQRCGCANQSDYVCEYHVAFDCGLGAALEVIRAHPEETLEYITYGLGA